jgi:nucleoside-diphosphate-sugar epimerase
MQGYEGTTVVVLGASGFIGRWVTRRLNECGAQVCALARDTIDLADFSQLEDVFRRFRPDITFNLAGYGVDPSERDDATAYRINAELPRALTEALAPVKNQNWQGRHFIHVGSGAEYGNAGGLLSEDGPACPTSLYGKSKLAGTRAAVERCRELGVRGLTARLFTVYGPGEHAGRLLPSLLEARRKGQALTLSSGLQRRDFTYVEDVAEGLLRLGLSQTEDAGIVNLATGQLTPVRAFVELAANIMGIPPENLHFGAISANSHEMEHQGISLERLQRLTAWIPGTSIAQGIRRALEISLL